ncbi:MAG TPA: hypothetical protein VKM55_07825 [Candidatus Lokiarchaeia archaeon]|nr:hypothetical protein [Candidatus Lokiarchaeia archaeon]
MSNNLNDLGNPIVIDVGTYSTKIGYAGEKEPRAIVRSLMAKNPSTQEWEFGDQVFPMIDQVKVHHPIDNGAITNLTLGNLTRFLAYLVIQVLGVNLADHALLFLINGKGIVEPDWDEIAWRLYSKLNIPGLSILRSGMPCIRALDLSTATIVQVGAGHSTVSPIINNFTMQRFIPRLWIGSQKDVDAILHHQLVTRGILPDTPGGLELARQIKEQVCYTSLNFEEEMKQAQMNGSECSATASLPSGKEVECGIERFYGPEVLFTTALHDHSLNGIDEVITNSLRYMTGGYRTRHADFQHSDEEWRQELASHIFLIGGHVTMPGFAQRIEKGVAARFPELNVSVTVPEPHDYFEWYSGSIVAGRDNIHWVSRNAWEYAGKSYKRAAIMGWEEGDYI